MDLGVADLGVADQSVADLGAADLGVADQSVADQSVADQSVTDHGETTDATSAITTPVTVPNGDFETIYKPGSTTVTGEMTPGGNAWTQGVGPGCPLHNAEAMEYEFSDSSSGDVADIPGWLGYDRQGWIALGGTYERDTASGDLQGAITNQNNHTPGGAHQYVVNGDTWGNPAGGLITSQAALGVILSDATYTLSMYASGSASPVVLHMLADGLVVDPTSSVHPILGGGFQEYSRTYDASDLSSYVGRSITIVLGVGRPQPDGASGAQSHFDDVTLSYIR